MMAIANVRPRAMSSTSPLTWEDLMLLEALVRFQAGISRSPEIRMRLEQLGRHVHQIALRQMYGEVDHLTREVTREC